MDTAASATFLAIRHSPPTEPKNSTVAIVHGFGASGSDWNDVATMLTASGNQVVLIQICQWMSTRHISEQLEILATAISDQLQAMGLTTLTIVGHSLGSLVARALCHEVRLDVHGVVEIAPPAQLSQVLAHSFISLGVLDLLADARASGNRERQSRVRDGIARLKRTGIHHMILRPTRVTRFNLTESYLPLNQPRIVVYGINDWLSPLTRISNASGKDTIAIIEPGLSHFNHSHNPRRTADLISRCLEILRVRSERGAP